MFPVRLYSYFYCLFGFNPNRSLGLVWIYCNFEVLDIPEYLSVVKSWTINHPDYLKGLVLHVMSPSEMGAFHFLSVPESAVLYVPQGAKSAFESDATWGTAFKTIKEYDVAGIDNAVTTSGIKSDRIEGLSGPTSTPWQRECI